MADGDTVYAYSILRRRVSSARHVSTQTRRLSRFCPIFQ
ncbi:hypothetical protein K788_0003815 [Paraburkholderia caribensis MBA4]|uniref:Uncharacterized protein n=1 Tax=Paraburkholderia caribensis MBA4 TaxID=1323664 RepID=A0A0P0RBE4_9BURK|nr:hypothetical protein K788_0003815 [Paraburkholderia caribensis MBA4]